MKFLKNWEKKSERLIEIKDEIYLHFVAKSTDMIVDWAPESTKAWQGIPFTVLKKVNIICNKIKILIERLNQLSDVLGYNKTQIKRK